MAVSQTTALNELIGGTPAANGTLSITTNESEWAFTSTHRDVALQLTSDVIWLYASQSGGPYTRVPADSAYTLPIPIKGQSVFAKTATGSGTLYASTVG